MSRQEIEGMEFLGVGFDPGYPGVALAFWKRYNAPDGTGYVILDLEDKYKTGCTERGEPWGDWLECTP